MIAIIITTLTCLFYGGGDWGPENGKGSAQATQSFSDNVAGTLYFITDRNFTAQVPEGTNINSK